MSSRPPNDHDLALLLNVMGTAMGIGVTPSAFSLQGMVLWPVVALALTVPAGVWPARNAARLAIRKVVNFHLLMYQRLRVRN